MRNIKSILPIAQDGIDIGSQWYSHVSSQLAYVTESVSAYSIRDSIEVFAILSPRCHLTRNIRSWLNWLHTGKPLEPTIRTVKRCLELWQSGFYATHGMPYKIGRFADALCGNENAIVVDTWICRAIGIDQSRLKNNGLRQSIDRLILRLSDCLGLCPRDSQASLWAGIIRHHNRKANLPDIIGEWKAYAH